MALTLIAYGGAAVTAVACLRVLIALRRNEPRQLMQGWLAIMLLAPALVFLVYRLAS